MFTDLKKYIRDVNTESKNLQMDNEMSDKSSYDAAVELLKLRSDIKDALLKKSIMCEIRDAIVTQKLIPYSSLDEMDTHYYLAKIATEYSEENIPTTVNILYKDDNDVDMLWIFGLPSGVVIAIEWNVRASTGSRCYESTSVLYDAVDNFAASMSMFFTSVDLEIM